MKIIKITSFLFAVLLLLNVSVPKMFGQEPQNPKPAENTGSAADKKTAQPNGEKVEVSDTAKSSVAATTGNPYKNQNNERYRIGFQDTLEIQVSKHPELTQVVSINSDGTIFLPRIDQPIIAVCKTEQELKDNITTLYKTYLRAPFVNVRSIDQKSQVFAVMGAVKKPGSFSLSRKIRLLELISLAGGYDVEFAGAKIQVARVGNVSDCKEDDSSEGEKDGVDFLNFNTKDVIEGKQNPWMQPGDIVSVLEAAEAYVVGNVFKPTRIPLKESVSLTKAIAFAGGLQTTAKTNKIVIQRQESNSLVKTELVFDLKDIYDKKIQDPLLQANDIVEVGTDTGKSVKKNFLKILTNGLPSVFMRVPLP